MPSSNNFFKRVILVGVGLIGGSWGLSLKRSGFLGHRTGVDTPEVLKKALRIGAIDSGETGLQRAIADADLVVLAAPVGEILQMLDRLKACAPPETLITDVGSTKEAICGKARENFTGAPLFIGGHPLAGKESSGIENAVDGLFDGAAYILTPGAGGAADDPRAQALIRLIGSLGARVVMMDPASHDRVMAPLSHLPQLVSTALASLVEEREDLPLDLAAAGFRDATRLAASPYGVWRDICASNRDNIQDALDAMIEKLEAIRDGLAGGASLEREFQRAGELREKLLRLRESAD